MKISIVTTILAGGGSFVSSFLTTDRRQIYRTKRCRTLVSLNMALTPIGPFCPFRSSASIEISPKMESLNAQTPEFATEMSRIQLDVQMGQLPDKDRLLKVAYGIDAAVDQWETLLARLSLSGDFQTKEYAKLTQAHLELHGISPKGIATMMKWQSGCMKAMALNRPPPMPPSELDLNKLMAQAQQSKQPPSMTGTNFYFQILCERVNYDSMISHKFSLQPWYQPKRSRRAHLQRATAYLMFHWLRKSMTNCVRTTLALLKWVQSMRTLIVLGNSPISMGLM